MAAATGWGYIASGGPALPGYLSPSEGITFASLPTAGYAAWDAVPENGKFQILGVIGILELLGEASVKPHYMAGGTPGKIMVGGYPLFDPIGFMGKLTPEQVCAGPSALALTAAPAPNADVLADRDVRPLREQKAYKLESEIKNGRLAMIGVASFFAAHWSTAAVPLLTGKIPMGDPANPLFGLS